MAFENDGGAGAGSGAGDGAGSGGSLAAALTGGADDGGAAAAAAAAGGSDDGGAAAAAAAAGAGDGAADPAWYADISADLGEGEKTSLRDWVKANGAKDLTHLAKIARDNQAALRDSGRIKLPGEGASEAEKTAFRAAIGVPDSAEGYVLAPIKDADGNELALDMPLLSRLAAKAHESGVPKAAYEALVNDFVAAQLEAAGGADTEAKAEGIAWAKEQGEKQAAKLSAVNRGAEAVGLTNDEVFAIRGAIGSRRTLDTLARLGEGIGEDVLLGGTGGAKQFMVSGEQAQAQIDVMKGDPATLSKMTVKGTPENARYERLVVIAGEAANRKAAAGL